MLRFLVDTNICIYAMRGRHPGVRERFVEHFGHIAISAVVLGELKFGVEKSDRPQASGEALAAFLKNLAVLPFDVDAAAHFGELRASLERAGTPCGHADIQVGAHARSLDLTLVTNNRREFDRMPGLKVENWV